MQEPGARVVLLVNPVSGRGRGARVAPVVADRLRARGLTVEAVCGTDRADAGRLLAQALRTPTAAVVVCGGDGSIALAVAHLTHTPTALGIVPAGTGNDTARTLAVPREPGRAADVVADALAGPAQQLPLLDVGEVEAADGSRQSFLSVVSTGFDALVNERANRMRWPHGRTRYVCAIAAELRVLHAVPYTVTYDHGQPNERRLERPGLLVAVGNGPSYGGGMRVCPGARLDDGLLTTTFVAAVPVPTFLRLLPGVFRGTHVRHRHVLTATATAVRVDAPGRVAYADGERVGPLPATVRIQPGSLRVAVPAAPVPTPPLAEPPIGPTRRPRVRRSGTP